MQKYADIELLDALNRRSEEVYRVLHQRWFRTLYVASLKITDNMTESEDIVSDVFIALFTKVTKEFPSLPAAFNYMHNAVRNGSLNYKINPHLKGVRYFELSHFEDIHGFHDVIDTLELAYREALWAVQFDKAIKAIECLKPVSKEVIKAIYFEQLSSTDTAERMGITRQTVLNLNSRALKRAKKIVNKDKILTESIVLILLLIIG